MTPTMQAVCKHLGRRPRSEAELTDLERRALAAEQTERRDEQKRPIERREIR
jgi:hypothetical protein